MTEERNKKSAICLLIGIVLVMLDYCNGQIDTQSEEKFVFDAPQGSRRSGVGALRQPLAIHPKRETTSRIIPLPRQPQEQVLPPVCWAPPSYRTKKLMHNELLYGEDVAKSVLKLARNIANSLYYSNEVKTQVFSPLSIAGALSLVLMGSCGETYKELVKALGYENNDLLRMPSLIHREFGSLINELTKNQNNRPISRWKCQRLPEELHFDSGILRGPLEEYHQVSVANGIFVQNDFSLNPDFKTAVESIYGGEIKPMDFRNAGGAAVQYINKWVNEKTNGKIKNILGNNINGETKMIITSALYFKGIWERSFIQGGTSMKNFYPDGEGGSPVPVEMMAIGGVFPFYNSQEYDCRILGLPYKGNLSTMYIILPNNSSREKLKRLQRELPAEAIEDMISKMKMKTAVMIFPKMHIENSINLKEILVGLGMGTLFSPGVSDLSLIGSEVGGSVQRPVQDSIQFLERDEELSLRPTIATQQDPSLRQRAMIDLMSRFGSNGPTYNYYQHVNNYNRGKRAVKYKVESSFRRSPEPLRLKDFIIAKRITKLNPDKKSIRHRRQATSRSLSAGEQSLLQLDGQRRSVKLPNPGLFAENILHKIDLTINEKGTEGGAATVIYLTRSGTDVIFRVDTPFMFLIRHEPTKLPIFYGSVFEPVNN